METKLDRVVSKAANSVAKVIGGGVLAAFWGFSIVGSIAKVVGLFACAAAALLSWASS
jgi:hypothetical protein